ncbi:MAG: DUF45 domain-containing protein [Bacilli bacterium]|nr:DUF45 domain-containing protein [Bacilli bacterium]
MVTNLNITINGTKFLIVADRDNKYIKPSIEFVDGHFVVKAPQNTSDATVKYWVNINAKNLLPKEFQKKPSYIFIFGKRYNVNTIVIDGKRIDSSDEKILKKQLEKILEEYGKDSFKRYSKIMGMNEKYKLFVRNDDKHLAYNDLYNKEIVLSYGLIHFSKEIIDSVVIHEITHCFVGDHSKAFYEIFSKYCPNYREYEYKFTHGKYR